MARERLERAGIAEGMPIVFADDGRPVSVLNRWLRSLPTCGAKSPNTWVGYAKDSIIWHSHLAGRDLDLFADRGALRDALADLYIRRRIDLALD